MKYLRASTVVLGLLCLMYFITYLDRVNVSSAAEGFGTEFGLSRTQIGLVFSAFVYPYLLFQLSFRVARKICKMTLGTLRRHSCPHRSCSMASP